MAHDDLGEDSRVEDVGDHGDKQTRYMTMTCTLVRLRRIMLAKSWNYAFMDSRIMLAKSIIMLWPAGIHTHFVVLVEPQSSENCAFSYLFVCIYFDSQIQTGIEPNNMKENMKIITCKWPLVQQNT